MGWFPPKKPNKQGRALAPSAKPIRVRRHRLEMRLRAKVSALRRRVARELPELPAPKPGQVPASGCSALDVWKGARRAGVSIGYYDAETIALGLDAEAVAAAHNRELLLKERERRVRERLRRECPWFCREAEGARPGGPDPGAAAVAPPREAERRGPRLREVPLDLLWRDDDDPEVLELFEEEQERFLANGDGHRGGRARAEALVYGMLTPGRKPAKAFGSGGVLVGGDGKRRIGVWRRLEDGTEEVEVEEF